MIPKADRSGAGSFFCTECGEEHKGIPKKCHKCRSRGTVEFIGENDSRYVKFVMGSKKKGNDETKIACYRPFIKNPNNKEERPWL